MASSGWKNIKPNLVSVESASDFAKVGDQVQAVEAMPVRFARY